MAPAASRPLPPTTAKWDFRKRCYKPGRGRKPKGYTWDGASGHYRHDVSGAVFVRGELSAAASASEKARSAAHVRATDAARKNHAQQEKKSKAKRVVVARHGKKKTHNLARCSDKIFEPGFDLSQVQ